LWLKPAGLSGVWSRRTPSILGRLGLLERIRSVGFAYYRSEFFNWQGNHIVTCLSNLNGEGVPANTAGKVRGTSPHRVARYGDLIGRSRDAIDGPEGIVFSPINEVDLSDPWFRTRAIILGDAAHASALHLTQGAGITLEV
jgi:hypothetical protein